MYVHEEGDAPGRRRFSNGGDEESINKPIHELAWSASRQHHTISLLDASKTQARETNSIKTDN